MTQPGARRRKTVALVLSGVFPGLGQFYNRQHGKGVLFVAAGIILSWFLGRAAPTDLRALAQPGASTLAPLLALVVLWIWSVVDAWRVASR